jgi:hypothetical protein
MTTNNFYVYLQNRLIQTGQTGGQWYNDTSPFVFPTFAIPSLWSGVHVSLEMYLLIFIFLIDKTIEIRKDRLSTGPNCFLRLASNNCARGHCKHNGTTCCIKAKNLIFLWQSHLHSLNLDTWGLYY